VSSCEECGSPLIWGGMSWTPHTEAQHAARRRALLRVVWQKLAEESLMRAVAQREALEGRVVVWWRIVLPDDIGHLCNEVPGDLWDAMDRDELLALMCSTVRDGVQRTRGVRPHRMQVKYRVFDERIGRGGR
jgi:hypothetical protein